MKCQVESLVALVLHSEQAKWNPGVFLLNLLNYYYLFIFAIPIPAKKKKKVHGPYQCDDL